MSLLNALYNTEMVNVFFITFLYELPEGLQCLMGGGKREIQMCSPFPQLNSPTYFLFSLSPYVCFCLRQNKEWHLVKECFPPPYSEICGRGLPSPQLTLVGFFGDKRNMSKTSFIF